MPEPRKNTVISTDVDADLLKRLDVRAEQEKRSRAAVIRRAIAFYVVHAPVVPADDVPAPVASGKAVAR